MDIQAPLDMSLLAPRPERLEQLSQEISGVGYDQHDVNVRLEIYKAAQMEQLVSAVGVLAQFCARAT